jgi:hypothetical protein
MIRIPSPLSTLKMIGLIFFALSAILFVWMIVAMRMTAVAVRRVERWWRRA